MRVWYPLSPRCLDRQRLLGEHREVHAIWVVLTQDRIGYSRHPEVLRWRGHLPALVERHEQLVVEMRRRGYRHASPLSGELGGVVVWPESLEPVEALRARLAAKQRGTT